MEDPNLKIERIRRKLGIDTRLCVFELSEGFLKISDDKIIVTLMGRLVIRNIDMCFDAYIEKMMREKPIFSRTV